MKPLGLQRSHLEQGSEAELVLGRTATGSGELPVHVDAVEAVLPQVAHDVLGEPPAPLLAVRDGHERDRADDPPPDRQQHPQTRILLLQRRRPCVQT